jgi:orotate phosphoribosyltransferase
MNPSAEFPSSPLTSHPATKLWQVERDGNPLRRYGHVSPFIGKLGPVDSEALNQIGQLTRFALPNLPEPTLVIGMTESSLLLAFFMALWQQKPVDLRFTSRKVRKEEGNRAFREPHSHGPEHFLALEEGRTYSQIIIIEDELTTGATLRNLILAIADVSTRIFVATLRDLRPENLRIELQSEMQATGIELEVLSLETVTWNSSAEIAPICPTFNPFGRRESDRAEGFENLRRSYYEFMPDAIYMIGECVDIALQFWLNLPPAERPELRQITRSPWVIEGQTLRHAQCFPGDGTGSRYFIYNFEPPKNGRALWIGEVSNVAVGEQFGEFLSAQGIASVGIEVAGE